jgi:hypothetical protein
VFKKKGIKFDDLNIAISDMRNFQLEQFKKMIEKDKSAVPGAVAEQPTTGKAGN